MRMTRVIKAIMNDGINPTVNWFTGFSADTTRKAREFKKITSRYTGNGVSFSLAMSGKMLGVLSISTNTKYNARCLKNRAICGSVCEHCFAVNTITHYGALGTNTKNNLDVLAHYLIPVNEWPTFSADDLGHMIRVESFGDVMTMTQCRNYMNLALANPDCTVTAWTKNPDIWREAFKMQSKPANLILIQSSLFLDRECSPLGDFIDKTFTVYTTDDSTINCGARSCRDCKRCYRQGRENVRELLK